MFFTAFINCAAEMATRSKMLNGSQMQLRKQYYRCLVTDFRFENSSYPEGFKKNPDVFQQLRSATGLSRLRVLAREFANDIHALWLYGAPFPTFLKLIATLILCLLIALPLVYPIFVLSITYFTCESLYLSWRLDQPWRFFPNKIVRRALSAVFRPATAQEVLKVREVLTRGILLAHSLATSVDYLCVMQGLLDET